MAAVSKGTVATHPEVRQPGGMWYVCGTCGCVMAYEHVTRHPEWHGAEWTPPTVKRDKTVGQ